MTATSQPAAPGASTVLANIEAALSADWAKFVAFIGQAEQDIATFLSKVASGAEIAIEDIETAAQYVAGHLSTITATTAALTSAAAVIAPGNADVAKVLTDLQTGANDVAALSNSLTTGSTAGANATVTTAVTAVTAVQTLATLAAQASSALSQLTAASPSATQVVSQPTPPQG